MAWLTKYWMSSGIQEVETEPTGDEAYCTSGDKMSRMFLKWDRDVFKTQQEAREFVDRARLRKIKSLKQQIARLEAMKIWQGATTMGTRRVHPVEVLIQESVTASKSLSTVEGQELRDYARAAVVQFRKDTADRDELKATLRTICDGVIADEWPTKHSDLAAANRLLGDWKPEPPVGFERGDDLDAAAAGR